MRSYPWREAGRTAYQVMVAELLLKRTTATAASRVYVVFLGKYRTLESLASASEERLRGDLQPIGLSSQRAKAITGLVTYLLQRAGGAIPRCLDELLQVPGLGEYSARAILSFGHGMPTAVVDSNVERVIRRVFGSALPIRPSHHLIQEVADYLLPPPSHRAFNFALLDLGALVCRYSRPICEECPLASCCDYYLTPTETTPVGEAGRLLREARTKKRMSLVELANRAQVSKLTIVNIEAGRTTAREETVAKLESALGTKLT